MMVELPRQQHEYLANKFAAYGLVNDSLIGMGQVGLHQTAENRPVIRHLHENVEQETTARTS
jgi:hypothetical protein